jgi:hypothetical protein
LAAILAKDRVQPYVEILYKIDSRHEVEFFSETAEEDRKSTGALKNFNPTLDKIKAALGTPSREHPAKSLQAVTPQGKKIAVLFYARVNEQGQTVWVSTVSSATK